jgi:predicted nuclease of predicted toxin-antitoxin system
VGDASDLDIMAYAKAHDYVLLTHDLDFAAILAATYGKKPSVMQIRAEQLAPDLIGLHIVSALRQLAVELDSGAFGYSRAETDTRARATFARAEFLGFRCGGKLSVKWFEIFAGEKAYSKFRTWLLHQGISGHPGRQWNPVSQPSVTSAVLDPLWILLSLRGLHATLIRGNSVRP